MEKSRHKSAVDGWLGTVLIVALLIPLLPVAITWHEAGTVDWIGVATFGFVAFVYGICLFPMTYVLDDEALKVRSGLIRWCIRYSDIKKAQCSRTLWSGPAMSLNRIEIHRRNGRPVVISPQDRSGFLDQLAARMPGAVRQDDAIVLTHPLPEQ